MPGGRQLKFISTYRDAIASAPDILFIAAAGNEDSDNRFSNAAPASFDLPNVITVAPVDQAGDEAAFTSYGKVEVYANGFEVASRVPGGEIQRWGSAHTTSAFRPTATETPGRLPARMRRRVDAIGPGNRTGSGASEIRAAAGSWPTAPEGPVRRSTRSAGAPAS